MEIYGKNASTQLHIGLDMGEDTRGWMLINTLKEEMIYATHE